MGFDWHPGDFTTLAEALSFHTVADLERLAGVAAIPSEGRKAERIEALCRALEGKRLRFLWGRLTANQKAAVALAAHSRDGRLSRQAFRLLYHEEPDFGEKSRPWSSLDKPSLLCLFIQGDRIPEDLRSRLRELVPPPEVPPLATIDAPPKSITVSAPAPRFEDPSAYEIHRYEVRVSERSAAALTELGDLLRLAEAHALSLTPQTGEPSLESARTIGAVLYGGDFFEENRKSGAALGPIRAFAWPRILLAGGLVAPRGRTLVLSAEGEEALGSPSPETLRLLWRSWSERGEPDEVHRLSGLEGSRSKEAKLLSPSSRRAAISDALRDCPVSEWVAVDAFFDHVLVSGRDFTVSENLEALRVDSFDRTSGLLAFAPEQRWLILQGRLILCSLFEYASTLGLIDVAYTPPVHARKDTREVSWADMLSRYDGLQAFRLTSLGAFCLGVASEPPAGLASLDPHLVVNGELEVRADSPVAAADRLVLEYWAEPLSDGVWLLDRTRALESIAKGRSPEQVREFLARRAKTPLPSGVTKFLKDCALRSRSLRFRGGASLFECRDSELAGLVASDPRTARFCHRAGENLLAIPLEHEKSFREALRRTGYGVDTRRRKP